MYFLKLILFSVLLLFCSSFNLPEEKKFIGRKVENILLTDAKGKQYDLYSLLNKKPIILSPIYTKCPSTCSIVSNGLKECTDKLGTLGIDFSIISFSFDSSDRKEELENFETHWKIDGESWRATTASFSEIPNLVIILTPSGRISRYVYGITPKAKDIKLAVMEASAEKTRLSIIKGLYLKCFAFDPVTKTYKLDWGFLISTSAGIFFIILISTMLLSTFKTAPSHE
jgi:protein SCO1/2